MFDVFYTNKKPNLFPFEKPAVDIFDAANQSSTEHFWLLDGANVYTEFDFEWRPAPWDAHFTHVFPNQWTKWGNTFFASKEHTVNAFTDNIKIQDLNNLKFVSDQYVKTANDNFDMYYVDHGNADNNLASLKERYPKIKVTRFVDNYLDTFKRIVNNTTSQYVWITSSLCNYSMFDFTWPPDPWQDKMIHCFGTTVEKRGDTFYIHVESFKAQMVELELLDWFNVICYHTENLVLRYDSPEIYYDTDNLVDVIKAHNFTTPYVTFTNVKGYTPHLEQCLWSQKDRKVLSATPDNGVACVPRDVKQYLKTQLYDYPYIDKQWNRALSATNLDVIFISNGEPDANEHWEKLKSLVPSAKRSDGVNGRAQAYQAAARMSNTHWFFAVFAKLDIDSAFDWSWQPDLFQQPKHYIFNSRNPLNGLEYGHQGMIAYNKKLVLENNNPGLDFTLSQPNETMPILSGTARFNQDPWTTWRTAFREVIKLKKFESEQSTIEGAHRLRTWLTKADGDYAEWCLRGAADGVNYYDSVKGDYKKLMLSFEWDWLKTRFNKSY